MNERIKKLKDQTLDKHFSYTWSKMDYDDVNKFAEKFAELIVRECCQYLENEAERLYSLSAKEDDEVYQANFEICAEKCYDNSQGLKDHFGVEE